MRNRSIIPIVAILSILTLTFCTKENTGELEIVNPIDFDTLVFEHSMKGWELYSWPNGVEWNFAVLPGTNTLKNYEQVKYQKIQVTGTESLKKLLAKMPEGEEIIWMSEHWLDKIWTSYFGNLMLPPETVVLDIDEYCIEIGLILTISF